MIAGFIDAAIAFLKAVNAILSLVPGLVWAVALVLTLGWGSAMHHERDTAIGQRDVLQAQLNGLIAKVVAQKKEARELYEKLLAARDALQAELHEWVKTQEKKDANDRKTIADQARRLADLAAAHGGQLRDPNGAGCRRGDPGAEGHAAADERGGEGDAAAAGGLLSAPLSRLLRELAADSDKWGRLYGLARDDALMCRKAQEGLP